MNANTDMAGKARSVGSQIQISDSPTPEDKPELIRTINELLLSALFLIAIWLSMFDSFLNLDHSPIPIENRPPAKFPVLASGVHGLKQYFGGLEAYFNDHFGFRKFLIRAHGYIQRRCLWEGSSDVLIGRDHWLYYVGNRALDYHMGLSTLNLEQLNQWQKLLESRQTWCAQRGIKYLFVVSPNKESIYPEYLPDWATRTNARTELDQFLAHMKTHSPVEILDLRPALLEAKKKGRVYLITDTHWNYLGAFAAYRALITSLAGQLPGLEPLSLDVFDVNYNTQTGGDLARMLAQEQAMPEQDFATLVPRPPLQPMQLKYNPAILEKKCLPDEQPAFFENPDGHYKVVMFRDSFAAYLTPFLGYHFKRIVFIWQRTWDTRVIDQEKPNIVIDEMLERYLDWPLPSQ